MVNLITYALSAINLFNSDRPKRRRFDPQRAGMTAWRWAKRHRELATLALAGLVLLVLFAYLFTNLR